MEQIYKHTIGFTCKDVPLKIQWLFIVLNSLIEKYTQIESGDRYL